jgi:hypothetical protein
MDDTQKERTAAATAVLRASKEASPNPLSLYQTPGLVSSLCELFQAFSGRLVPILRLFPPSSALPSNREAATTKK